MHVYYIRIMAKSKTKISESEILAKLAAQGMSNKKGDDIVLLDLREVESAPANYFVICSGNVPSHVSAISDGVFETIKKATGINPLRVEGYDNAEWILMDYFDVVVHIFMKDKRDHYRIEALWADGVRSEYEEPTPVSGTEKKTAPKGRKATATGRKDASGEKK